MSESRLNIGLLKKVRDKIATAPTAYNQGTTAQMSGESPCGTAACIGGWADILSAGTEKERRERMSGDVNLDRAADALGLSGSKFICEMPIGPRRTERAVLFDATPEDYWPAPFAFKWQRAKSAQGRARVAVAYLDHIIKTGKVFE